VIALRGDTINTDERNGEREREKQVFVVANKTRVIRNGEGIKM